MTTPDHFIKKKRKRKYFQMNNNKANATPSSAHLEQSENSESGQPAKKRKWKKKKKVAAAAGDSSAVNFKPVLIVKKPEDYSANWKLLKEIITEGDKKSDSHKPETKNCNMNNELCSKDSSIKPKYGKQKKVTKSGEGLGNKTVAKKEKLDIWFDNVDPILLEMDEEDTETQDNKEQAKRNSKRGSQHNKAGNSVSLVKEKSFAGLTKVIAMDCEMVGVGINGRDSILARVSIVNHFGKVLYDKYVKPTEEVVDYRTKVSGIRPADLEKGDEFSTVQKEVADMLKGRILVGHSVNNDLRMFFLSHPRALIRDTAKYRRFKQLFGGRTPSLKKLTERLMGIQIQEGEHSSVQDAQAAMRLYTMHRREWEAGRSRKQRIDTKKNNSKSPNSKQQLTTEDSPGE